MYFLMLWRVAAHDIVITPIVVDEGVKWKMKCSLFVRSQFSVFYIINSLAFFWHSPLVIFAAYATDGEDLMIFHCFKKFFGTASLYVNAINCPSLII